MLCARVSFPNPPTVGRNLLLCEAHEILLHSCVEPALEVAHVEQEGVVLWGGNKGMCGVKEEAEGEDGHVLWSSRGQGMCFASHLEGCDIEQGVHPDTETRPHVRAHTSTCRDTCTQTALSAHSSTAPRGKRTQGNRAEWDGGASIMKGKDG